MPTIMISIMPDDGIPVDKMEEDDEGNNCPLPTQDEELNDKNRQVCIDDANYGEGGLKTNCGNCGAYNQTDEMMDCMDDDSGDIGYCQKWKFMCQSDNVCDSWVKGGPITSEKQSNYKEYL
jgi:hypothetical protein